MEHRFDSDFYTYSEKERVAILKFNTKIFELVTGLDASDTLFRHLKEIEYDKNIKALLVLHDNEALNEKSYDDFLNKLISEREDDEETPDFCEKNVRFREINILNNLIRHFFDFQKICFIGISGDLVTPFFGLSLAFDIRILSEKANFIMAHNKYGLHPSGALPYFLTQFLGYAKAVELQLTDHISAKEAKDTGLATHILADKNFEDKCLEIIFRYMKIRSCTLRNTKRLNHFSREALEKYFQYEAEILNL